jgi:hypothetical protein
MLFKEIITVYTAHRTGKINKTSLIYNRRHTTRCNRYALMGHVLPTSSNRSESLHTFEIIWQSGTSGVPLITLRGVSLSCWGEPSVWGVSVHRPVRSAGQCDTTRKRSIESEVRQAVHQLLYVRNAVNVEVVGPVTKISGDHATL